MAAQPDLDNTTQATELSELFAGPRPEPLDRAKLPSTEWELVDRSLAEQYLELNEGNRKARRDTVQTYVRDLEHGKWEVTGDAIRFDTSGRLIDGQHRLMAVAKSGIPAWFLVIRGLEPRVQSVLDTQARRSAADALRFTGVEKNAHLIAALARQALTYTEFFANDEETPVFVNRAAPSHSEVEEWVQDHPEVHEAAVMANLLKKSANNGHVAWGLAWMKMMAIDPTEAIEFFTSMANYQTRGPKDPRHTLLKFQPASKGRGRLAVGEQLCAITIAWNYYRAGEDLEIIRTRLNGQYRRIPVAA